jgi:pentatricopeptide repeat protein
MTFATLLDACASLAALTEGNNFYKQLLVDGIDPDLILATALINLYSRCGCIEDARRVFDRMPKQNVASWNCIIAAYHRQGDVNQVHNLFKLMQKEKIRPDAITFLSIVSSFSHAGLVDEAYNYLNSMVHNHGLTPTVEHYNCMIDLLGRAGCLDQVEEMLVGSPFEATLHSCMSSLNACRVHLDVERGKRVMESITKFTPANNASKVLMSNIYAAANQFQEASLSRAA